MAIRAAVQAILDSWNPATQTWPEDQIPAEYQDAILAGVKAGGEKMHSLDALIALAQYEDAKVTGKPFKVRMMGEVDGVTNGPMLSHLLLGAASSAEKLFGLLNKGGFFQMDSPFQNYNLWRDPSNGFGHRDLYETTIGYVMDHVNQKAQGSESRQRILKSVWAITGRLADDKGNILKDGRNIIKTPLTAMIFGSAIDGATNSMFEDFVAKTYAGFEKLAILEGKDQEIARRAYLTHVHRLLTQYGGPGMENLSVQDLLAYEFTRPQVEALRNAFEDTIGSAVKATMQTHFADFIDTRRHINTTAQASFALYDAIYQSIKGEFIKELEAKGEIFATKLKSGETVAQMDLTAEQEAELQKRIAVINPVLNTLMSQRSGGDLSTGLHISKDSRKFSTAAAYQASVKFAKRLAKGKFSLSVAAYEQAMIAPGVAMLPMMVHSLDSAISHMAAMGTQVLNVHDAHGSGLQHFTRTAQNLNRATWKAVLEYSPAAEMRNAWGRTVLGLDAMLHSGESADAMIPAVKAVLNELAQKYSESKKPLPLNKVLQTVTDQITYTAYKADTVRLSTLKEMQAVDQYALEGGHYEVSEADRADAAKRLAELSSAIDPEVSAAIARINATLAKSKATTKQAPIASQVMEEMEAIPTVTKTYPWGKLGEATVASDPALVAAFHAKPTMTAVEALRLAYASFNGTQNERMQSFYRNLITKLAQVAPKTLTVTLLTRDSSAADVQHPESIPKDGVRGWFTTTPEGHIYVLAPEFENSGLTGELLIHEVLHGVLANIIESNDPQVRELVQELEALREKAATYIKDNLSAEEQGNYTAAVSSVHEFVSWGMSNAGFQRKVLAQISHASKTRGNVLVNGMKAFISAITNLLFKGSTKSEQQIMDNGMTVLIQNVSGLLEAKTTTPATPVSYGMAANAARDYSTVELFDGLRSVPLDPTFESHLKDVLGTVVEKLHGPFGSLMAARMEAQTISAQDIWLKAVTEGAAPFAQEAMSGGFPFSDQEAFAAQQVEASVRAVLDRNDNTTTQSYKELSKLYREMRDTLTPADFNTGDPVQDQALYDFLFKMDAGADGRTDHLARFATLGLTNQHVHQALDRATSMNPASSAKSFGERLSNWLSRALEWLANQTTHTYAGQQANEKLLRLVDNLVAIETSTRERMQVKKESVLAPLEAKLTHFAEGAKKGIGDLAQSHLVQGSSKTFVKFAGNVVSTVAHNRVDQLMNAFEAFRDAHFKEHHGVVAGLINEIRGAREGNLVFHSLLRASKHLENLRKNIITGTSKVVLESFADKGANLSRRDKKAITAVFLRTDFSALLDSLGMLGIQRVLNTQTALEQEIQKEEAALSKYSEQHFYIKEAKVLAYYMATGKVRGTHLLMNAHNIASARGTHRAGLVPAAQTQAAEAVLDRLVSLYALKYTPMNQIIPARNILNKEMSRGNENGVEMTLKLHRQLQQQSRERLFDNSPIQMMKGYTPEIYNPHREVVVASAQEGKELEAAGYVRGSAVTTDPKDPDQTLRHIYMLANGGMRAHLTGVISYTGKRSKGSRAASNEVSNLDEWQIDQDNLTQMYRGKQADISRLFTADPGFDPAKVKTTFAAPVLDGQGEVMNFRYLMENKTKDILLQRDNSFDTVMGTLAGGIFDKETAKDQNRKAIQALKEQYDAEYAKRSDSYVVVDETSTDSEYREIYRLLPEETKQAIREIWGERPMMVRVDLLDINFGYRKSSLSTWFERDYQVKGAVDKFVVENIAPLLPKTTALRIRQAEDIMQEIVRETKDILVVKTGLTLLGNVTSNFTLLYWYGVPLADQLRHHRTAMRGVIDYHRDSRELAALTAQLEADYITGNRTEMQREVKRLRNEIERNPVKKLIDAGMLPTIVEDVAAEDDIYSYKSLLVKKAERLTNQLNPSIKAAGRVVYMAKDTKMYQALSYATQVSDFLARYTMYQYATTRKVNPLSHEDAIQLAADCFVNYDVPTHRTIQYLNDMGVVWFTKYYLRIQKVIAHLYVDNPGRGLMLLSLEHFFAGLPTLTDSSFVNKLHNPFSVGAFKYPGVLDELATVKMGMSPFN